MTSLQIAPQTTMASEMLDDMLRGMSREIGAEVHTYLYDHVWARHVPLDYDQLDQAVVTAFMMTEKPAGVTHDLWDEFLETCRTGTEIGVRMTWPMFWDANIEDEDDVFGGVHVIMHTVFARVARTIGPRMLQEVEESERAATRIQATWREAIANPRHGLCRQRLAREFQDLCGGLKGCLV